MLVIVIHAYLKIIKTFSMILICFVTYYNCIHSIIIHYIRAIRKPKATFTVHVHVHVCVGVTPYYIVWRYRQVSSPAAPPPKLRYNDIMESHREIIAYLAHSSCTTREIQKLLVDVCGKSLRFAVH